MAATKAASWMRDPRLAALGPLATHDERVFPMSADARESRWRRAVQVRSSESVWECAIAPASCEVRGTHRVPLPCARWAAFGTDCPSQVGGSDTSSPPSPKHCTALVRGAETVMHVDYCAILIVRRTG